MAKAGTLKNPFNEKETRNRLLGYANRYGMGKGLQEMLDKYDRMIKNCGNDLERQHMKQLALAEIHNFLGFIDGLEMNGEMIISARD